MQKVTFTDFHEITFDNNDESEFNSLYANTAPLTPLKM